MRGELKLMENVMAFFMIIIIAMIALIFFSVNQWQENQARSEERATMRAVQIARSLYNLPELSCTYSDAGRCIDAQKAAAFAQVVTDENLSVYFNTFGRSEIAIRCLGCDGITIYDLIDSTSYLQFQVPVLVHNATSDVRRFGWIEVRV